MIKQLNPQLWKYFSKQDTTKRFCKVDHFKNELNNLDIDNQTKQN